MAPTTELGACEWFVWDLQRSGLVDRGQLDQILGEFLRRTPRSDPKTLAKFLIEQDVLTPLQADRLLAGKTQGLVLGPYVLMESLGTGSMGQVYKAVSRSDNQYYALKVLPRRSMWNVRLARRQVRSFTQFSHPSIVPFVDVGTSGGQHYLCWPLVTGEALDSIVTRVGKLTPNQTANMALQIAQALNVCHQRELFHGLLKPSNIMIGIDGKVKILDFGIGSLLVENEGESLVDTMSTANTLTSGLDCASPESIVEPTNRTPAGDQYSLGCVIYYCLARCFPFPEGSAVEKMMSHQFNEPTDLAELSPECPSRMVELVKKLMRKQPNERYHGMDDIVEELEAIVDLSAEANLPQPEVVSSQDTSDPDTMPLSSQESDAAIMAGDSISELEAQNLPFAEDEDVEPTMPPSRPAPIRSAPSPVPTRASLSQPPAGTRAVPSRPSNGGRPLPPGLSEVEITLSPAATQPPQRVPSMPQRAQSSRPSMTESMARQRPGGWIPEEKESGFQLGQTGLVVMTIAIIAGVWFIATNFLFGN